ncbi:peptidoglycan-binding protein [Shinella sp. CPCC 101442]|uniref:peptidoglycan-binding domain-containing protein n=1 Tax=Shinella sp. CPCC 101442 TaxID=2932265 RepID=UPI0021522204|nr:peptidoglycan-binding domain-containing protein [Shinella sp. CPCC 101442]MCR6498929.1 peptidoglycan-binding protein [Shinella sp. CPCC 101442]
MNAHVRKQPERRPQGQARKGRSGARAPQMPQRRANIVLTGLAAIGGLAARNPTAVGGTCAFLVVFSFVAANALWYQPGGHPAPFLKTRSADNSLGFTATRPDPHDVTTFVIEREEEGQELPEVTDVTPGERPFDEVAKVVEAKPATTAKAVAEEETDPVAAAIMRAEADPGVTSAVAKPVPSEIVMKIQKGLSNIAYTDIAVDGLIGEKTRLAIRHFEKHYRLPVTGEPNEQVLAKLKDIGAL